MTEVVTPLTPSKTESNPLKNRNGGIIKSPLPFAPFTPHEEIRLNEADMQEEHPYRDNTPTIPDGNPAFTTDTLFKTQTMPTMKVAKPGLKNVFLSIKNGVQRFFGYQPDGTYYAQSRGTDH